MSETEGGSGLQYIWTQIKDWVLSKKYLTEHQDISGKADKSATVSSVAYDSNNKIITKTINGVISNVVSAAKIVADGGGGANNRRCYNAVNTNNTFATSDNVLFSSSSIVIGKNGCTITDDLGMPFYFAQSDQSEITLIYSSWSNVTRTHLWAIFIDTTKLVRNGRVSSILDTTIATCISNPNDNSAYLEAINNPNRYILFAFIYKGNILPAGVFAKPEFYASSS